MQLCCSNHDRRNARTSEWLAAVDSAGITGVSLVVGEADSRAELEAGLRRTRGHGLTLCAVELATAEVEAWLPRARDAGASHVVTALGTAASPDDPPPGPLVEELTRMADAAAAAGLTLCLDTAPGLGGHSRSMARTLDAAGHPALRLCFDTGRYLQLNPGANGEVALQRVLGHLGCLRLTDVDLNDEPPTPVPLGMGGEIDFARTLQMVRALEFSGPVIVAVPAAELTVQCGFLRECARHLADCGWLDG